ncbi:hypothetical protein CDAR_411741 [Caerostris darwini]|uniref:Uncharacterized protein n=1 Tax=Caerostris darwini TaxID=1538125 RepID=A0AAV4MHD0_9ARAC|nr:hypothetical protein CDAR_411741 [Caerostris darwini]
MGWGGLEGWGTKRTNYRTKMERKVLFIPPPHSISPLHTKTHPLVSCSKKNKIRNTSCLASTNKTELPDTRASVINISCALALVPALSYYFFRALRSVLLLARGEGASEFDPPPSCRDIAALKNLFHLTRTGQFEIVSAIGAKFEKWNGGGGGRDSGDKKKKLSYKNGTKNTVYSSATFYLSSLLHTKTHPPVSCSKKNKISNTSCLASTNKTELPDTRATVINISCALSLVPALSYYFFRALRSMLLLNGQFENCFSNKCQQIAINDALTKKKKRKEGRRTFTSLVPNKRTGETRKIPLPSYSPTEFEKWNGGRRWRGYKKNKLSYKNGTKSTVYSSLPPPHSISSPHTKTHPLVSCSKKNKISNASCLASTNKTELPDTRAPVINISCALALVPALSYYFF